MPTQNSSPVNFKVWWGPKAPASQNDKWEFTVTITFESGEQRSVQWLLPDLELQEIAFAAIGRHLHDYPDGNAAAFRDLEANWPALQLVMNERASMFFKANRSQLPKLPPSK